MIKEIRGKLNENIGKEVCIKYNLGRNKFEKYNVKIKEIYENVFLVELDNNQTKSFTYIDVITKNLKIKYKI